MVYSPPPPCFYFQCCYDIFEFSKFCTNIGKIGIRYFDTHRAVIMLTATFVTFACLILTTFALVAVSDFNSYVKTTCWTYGDVDDGSKIYIGLNQIVIEQPGMPDQSIVWGDSACHKFEQANGDQNFCEECRNECDGSVGVAIVSLITVLPTLTTDIKRSTRRGDMNCQKFMGILTGVLGFTTTLASLSAYAGGCYRNLPSTYNGKNIDYSLGPGFICLLIATVLKIFDVVVNVCLPVVPYLDPTVRLDETLIDPADKNELSNEQQQQQDAAVVNLKQSSEQRDEPSFHNV